MVKLKVTSVSLTTLFIGLFCTNVCVYVCVCVHVQSVVVAFATYFAGFRGHGLMYCTKKKSELVAQRHILLQFSLAVAAILVIKCIKDYNTITYKSARTKREGSERNKEGERKKETREIKRGFRLLFQFFFCHYMVSHTLFWVFKLAFACTNWILSLLLLLLSILQKHYIFKRITNVVNFNLMHRM